MDDLNLGLALAGLLMLIGLQRMHAGHAAFPWFASGFGASILVPILLGGGENQVLMLAALALGLGLALILGLISNLGDLPARLALLHGLAGAATALLASLAMLEQILDPGLTLGLASLSLLLGAFSAAGAAVAHLRLSRLLPRVLRHASQTWIGAALLLATLSLGVLLSLGIKDQVFWQTAFFTLAALSGVVFSLPLAEREAPLAAAWLGALTGLSMALLGIALGLAPLLATGILSATLTLFLSMELGRRVNMPLSRLLWGAQAAQQSADAAERVTQTISLDILAGDLARAPQVLLIPGFGCIAADGCTQLVRLAQSLQRQGVKVQLLAHPLAGRLPGQLALLLREAGADETLLLERWNPGQPLPALTLSIGAHDLINPQRADMENGIPDLSLSPQSKEARVVLMLTQTQGFSGQDNPLLKDEHVYVLQADARSALEQLNQRLASVGA
ncbi:MAG: NAD(P)(+) transhydrogenase (Re/Si-specific) subunit beta [Pseudomonadota bacterium]